MPPLRGSPVLTAYPSSRAGAGVLDGGRDGEADLDGAVERVVVLDLPLDGGVVGLALEIHRDARVEAVVRDRERFERRVAEPRSDVRGERAARPLEDERRRVPAEGCRHLKIPSPNQIHKIISPLSDVKFDESR